MSYWMFCFQEVILSMSSPILMNKEYRIGITSFEKFAEIQSKIKDYPKTDVIVDCRNTTYISPAFLSLLGSLIDFGNFHNKKVQITYNRINGKRYIGSVGIDKYYTLKGHPHKDAVCFSSLDWINTQSQLLKERIEKIIDECPKSLGDTEKGVLFSILGEIFNNARDHSGLHLNKNTKIYYCGNWNSHNNQYIMSIYDTGVGIRSNVSKYLNDKDMNDAQALSWAFGDGNSTQNTIDKDFSRGIGLNSLERLVTVNNGTLYVGSGNAICVLRDGKKSIKTIKTPLYGTIYVLAIEVNEKRRFRIV